ncbi:MAG: gliding motility-associated C-terminal domain-containing protein [Saprospiraceae bacterium]|nr:gliding motility-associated C-terminal domain-containing protein [Saprospiraceae bacterium]
MPPAKLSNGAFLLFFLLFFQAPQLANASGQHCVAPGATDTVFLSYVISRCEGDSFQGIPVLRDTIISRFASGGASGTDTVFTWIVEAVPLPDFNILADTFFCSGSMASASVAGTYASYQWSGGQTGKSIAVDQPGWYHVTVSNSLGCQAADSVYIQKVMLRLIAVRKHPTCAGASDGSIDLLVLGASSSAPPVILVNQQPAPAPPIENLPAGNYSVLVTDVTGCADSLSLSLDDPPAFTVDAGPDLQLDAGAAAALSAQGSQPILAFLWQPENLFDCPDCPNPNLLQSEPARVILTATNADGCTASDTLFITINPEIPLYVPNVFSPNGDDQNDVLTISTGPSIRLIDRFQVFDRWGNLVYWAENLPTGPQIDSWDGFRPGDRPQPGVYTWLASVRFADNTTAVRAGTVTLLP